VLGDLAEFLKGNSVRVQGFMICPAREFLETVYSFLVESNCLRLGADSKSEEGGEQMLGPGPAVFFFFLTPVMLLRFAWYSRSAGKYCSIITLFERPSPYAVAFSEISYLYAWTSEVNASVG